MFFHFFKKIFYIKKKFLNLCKKDFFLRRFFPIVKKMTKNLVIVESPTKAKMLRRFLGDKFAVESSFGHIRDLPNKKAELPPSKQKLPHASLAIDIEKNFEPIYVVPPKAKKHATKLKKLVDEKTTIWLASDEDREGEAISWHLLEVLKPKKTNKIHRIVFHEITKKAILDAVKNPRNIDQNLVDAQQARRILDRLVGYKISPILWKKIRFGLSAGRVQSIAVKILVDREREIRAFVPVEFWTILAHLEKDGKKFIANFQKLDGKKFVPKNENEAEAIFSVISGQDFVVKKIDEREVSRKPAPPFTTSTLQQEAARKLGFSVKKTMTLAQKLYEGIEAGGEAGGLITYMRTDSVNLSEKALSDAAKIISKKYGKDFLETRKWKTTKKGAQEAHEAIRPTELSKTPDEIYALPKTKLDADARKLYELIWKRTISSQMANAKMMQTGVDFEVFSKAGAKKSHLFRATGQRIVFPGFLKVYHEDSDDDQNDIGENLLPAFKVGEKIRPQKLEKKQHFTKPPARYTEASLVKKMESEGIGRPSTYAPTISTIQSRGYVKKEGRQLIPTDTAFVVTDFLVASFPEIMNLEFTAKMENSLDDIAAQKIDRVSFLKNFWKTFSAVLEKGEKVSRAVAKKERELGKCPDTGKPIFAKFGRFGPMLQRGATESDEKPDFAPILSTQNLETITLDDALRNFQIPRILGRDGDTEIRVAVGKFGPYIQKGNIFVSIPESDIFQIDLPTAIEKIHEKEQFEKNKIIADFGEIKVLNGKFGPYITDGAKNAKIPKDADPKKITEKKARELLEKAPTRKWGRRKKN